MARRITSYADDMDEIQSKKRINVDNELIQQMLANINIAQILTDEYGLMLEQVKPNQYKGNCPFPDHRDSNPSFSVNDEMGVYNCWGCNRSGNLLTFLMKIEGLAFAEAILRLSILSGVNIEGYDNKTHRAIRGVREIINNFNNTYAESDLPAGMSVNFFMKNLAQRLKEYENKVNYDPVEIEWIEDIYKQIDFEEEEEQYKEMSKLWNDLSRMLPERYKQYRERINGRKNNL
jgi:DNA primase